MLHVNPDAIRYLQRRGYIPRHHALTFAAPVGDFPAWAARYDRLHQQAGTLLEADLGPLLGALFTEQRSADAPAATAPLRQLVQDVQDYLGGARQHKLSLDALAQRFALDKYQLIRHFSRFTGVTPNKYLTILRVEQAKVLLAAGQPLVEMGTPAGGRALISSSDMKQSFWFFGAHVSILADERSTHGVYDLIEGDFAARCTTPWHVHRAYAEEIYVVSGELTVHTKGRATVLRAGEKAVIPPGVAHRVVGAAAGTSRALTIASPSGFAHLIKTLGVPVAMSTTPARAPGLLKAARAMAAVGDEVLGVLKGEFTVHTESGAVVLKPCDSFHFAATTHLLLITRMLKLLSAVAALLPAVAVGAPAPAPASFVVQGYLPATKAHKAYLSYYRGSTYVVDSVAITNGRFQLKGLVDKPQQASLKLPPPGTSYTHMMEQDVATIYLEKGTISLTGTGLPSQAAATGTPLNREHAALAGQTAPLQAQLTTLSGARRRQATADTALAHLTDAQQAQLTKQLQAVYEAYIQAHPANPFSLYALADYQGYQPDAAACATLFQALAPSVRTSPHGHLMQQQLAQLQRTAIGALAPDFSLPDPSGKLVKLADLRGQYVLVDFWASWCRPCRAENPDVAKAYATYRNQNFTVVSISLDNQSARAAWLKAIQDDGLIWPQVSDLRGFNTEVAQHYSISSI
nr:hypothetical protein [Tanacetum cinerariifolium]